MNTPKILLSLLRYSPMILLTSLSIGFLICCIFFSRFYYTYLLPTIFPHDYARLLISFLGALMVQSLRFAFALSGAFDYARGNESGKKWGFGFSFAITIWEVLEAYFAILKMDTENNFWSLYIFILGFILFSFIAEIRLTLQLSGSIEKQEDKDSFELEKEKLTNEEGDIEFLKLSENQRIDFMEKYLFTFLDKHNRNPILSEVKRDIGVSTTTGAKYVKLVQEKNH